MADTVGLYSPSNAFFFLYDDAGTIQDRFGYGPLNNSWQTLAGDWDGDGDDEVGLYDEATSAFFFRADDGTTTFENFGPLNQGWVALSGDWDGDGADGIGMYDAETSAFFFRTDDGVTSFTNYGPLNENWKPITGDWDGDGQDGIGLYDPDAAIFYLQNDDGVSAGNINFGSPSNDWVPVTGDWDDDGVDEVGLYDQTNGVVYKVDHDGTFTFENVGPLGQDWGIVAGDWAEDAATFALTASTASVDEGDNAIFELVAGEPNFTYNYTISGVDAADVDGGLTGSVTTDANGAATITVALAADRTTEADAESLTVSLPNTGLEASVVVNDTSQDNQAPVAEDADPVTVAEDADPVTGQLTATDPEGDGVVFTLDAPVEGLTLNADGSYTFNPADNTAADALTYSDDPLEITANYTVTDDYAADPKTDNGTLNITVTPTPLTFDLVATADNVEEGSTVGYKLVASEPVDTAFTGEIQVSAGDGSAGQTEAADFGSGSLNPVSVTIAAGETESTEMTLTPTNDAETEAPESYTVTGTIDGQEITLEGEVRDPSTVGGLGQTFTLTTSVDTIPGLIGSAGSTGTDGDDTIIGLIDKDTPANTTFNPLDDINAGLGENTFRLDFVGDGADGTAANELQAFPGGITLTNIDTMNIRAAGDVGEIGTVNALDLSGQSFSTINVTVGDDVSVEAASTTDVNYSGLTGVLEVDGAQNVTVTDATAGNAITIGAATAPAGTIDVTDSDQGAGVIAIDGGTDVTVNNTNGTGATTIGATTEPTGAVDVNTTLDSDGAALVGGATNVTGGTSIDVTVDATNTADAAADAGALSVGAITATAGDSTTTVNITQNLTNETFTEPATGQVTETASVKFGALKSGDDLTVGGLTFTAAKDLTAEEVAQAFSELTVVDTQDDGGPVANGIYTGALAGWTSAEASGDTVVFTSTTANTNVGNLTPVLTNVSGNSVAPTVTTTDGAAGTAAATSGNSTAAGAVIVNENATASVTDVTVDTYASADLGDTGTDLDALTTLSLANSAGAATVATAATSLDLTVNNVMHAVSLDATAATVETLNLTASGASSAFGLTSAATTALNVTADANLNLTGSVLTVLETATITGAGDVALGDISASATSVDAGTATGDISATVAGDTADVTTNTGDDAITVDTAALSKDVDLGAGNDTLTLSAATASVPTGTVAGGADTDTVAMTFASAQALDGNTNFATAISGFERLTISDQVDVDGDVTIDLEALGFDNYVTLAAGTTDSNTSTDNTAGTLILDNMANGATVALEAAAVGNPGSSTQVNIKDAATNAADVLNLKVSGEATIAAGTVTANDVEALNIEAEDVFLDDGTGADTNDANHTLTAAGDSYTSVTVTGDDLTLDTDSAVLTSVDASVMTGGITYTADGDSAGTTVQGGQGSDALTGAGSNDILKGGAANDTLTGTSLTELWGEDGADTFMMNTPTNVNSYSTIMDAESGDVIDLSPVVSTGLSFVSSEIELADTAVFQDYANATVNQLATDDQDFAWFQYNGNTFIIGNDDQTEATDVNFENGTDSIIKLAGVHDLSTASYNMTDGTLELA